MPHHCTTRCLPFALYVHHLAARKLLFCCVLTWTWDEACGSKDWEEEQIHTLSHKRSVTRAQQVNTHTQAVVTYIFICKCHGAANSVICKMGLKRFVVVLYWHLCSHSLIFFQWAEVFHKTHTKKTHWSLGFYLRQHVLQKWWFADFADAKVACFCVYLCRPFLFLYIKSASNLLVNQRATIARTTYITAALTTYDVTCSWRECPIL